MTVPPRKIVLPNGLRVILAPQPGVTATVLVLAEAGSEYEEKRTLGISHFLEHLVFKGTKSRPEPGMIMGELEGLGAQYNAMTMPELTGYYAKARKEKLSQILDLVSDMYLEPIFHATEIEKERGVIIEEINMRENLPGWRSHFLFMETLYGDQPAGWNVIGTKDTVRAATREDIIAYRSARYHPASTIIIVAGDFEEALILAFIEARFGSLIATLPPAKIATQLREPGVRVTLQDPKISDQVQIMFGVPTFSAMDPRRHSADLLAHVLGGGMSSRLPRRIREEMGAAYSVECESHASVDHGYFAVSAGLAPAKLEDALQAIVEECGRLRDELIPEAELRKAKDHFTGIFMLGLETSDSLADFYGDQELFSKELLTPEQLVEKMEHITAEELQSLAREIFKKEMYTLSAVGPIEDAEPLRKILENPPL